MLIAMVSFYILFIVFCAIVHFNTKTEHLRVEWSEGLIVEPEDDVGTLPALSPGV